jgi:hypothetical protein
MEAFLIIVRLLCAFGLGTALAAPGSTLAKMIAGGCGAAIVFLDNSAAAFLQKLKQNNDENNNKHSNS